MLTLSCGSTTTTGGSALNEGAVDAAIRADEPLKTISFSWGNIKINFFRKKSN